MPHTEAIRNWKLLEIEIVEALQAEGKHIAKNADGDPCAYGVNIAKLAQALSLRGVLVTVTPHSVKID